MSLMYFRGLDNIAKVFLINFLGRARSPSHNKKCGMDGLLARPSYLWDGLEAHPTIKKCGMGF